MPDYIYLLENRLTADQKHALRLLRDVAREAGIILFLTGGAVRDLTNGYAVRGLEVAVNGNALKLKKTIEKSGAVVWGEDEETKTISFCFPGTVRVDLVSTHRAEYLKPGKPVYHRASIQEYLRGRDFTANAMAISLNEGSYGLLMDPLNGAADIESRTLRLASAYGFLEEPSFLIRATRYLTRLGWQFDDRTRMRFENALEEGVIAHLSPRRRGLELEQIAHEDEGLKILAAYDAAGWMKVLYPPWTAAKADEAQLNALHELAVRFELQGVHADLSAARMQLLTARLSPKDRQALQKLLPTHGFVAEWNSLDKIADGFGKALMAKGRQTPSTRYKLFMNHDPEAVLWLGFTSKNAAIRVHFDQFLTEWPTVRQRMPHMLLQEMRIVSELPVYKEVLESLFLAFIDGTLTTTEEIRAFLEPYSPPAPPPPVTIKRTRAKRNAALRVKEDDVDEDDADSSRDDEDEDLDDLGADDDLDLDDRHSASAIPQGREDAEVDESGAEGEKSAVGGAAKSKHGKLTPVAAKPAKNAKPAKTTEIELVAKSAGGVKNSVAKSAALPKTIPVDVNAVKSGMAQKHSVPEQSGAKSGSKSSSKLGALSGTKSGTAKGANLKGSSTKDSGLKSSSTKSSGAKIAKATKPAVLKAVVATKKAAVGANKKATVGANKAAGTKKAEASKAGNNQSKAVGKKSVGKKSAANKKSSTKKLPLKPVVHSKTSKSAGTKGGSKKQDAKKKPMAKLVVKPGAKSLSKLGVKKAAPVPLKKAKAGPTKSLKTKAVSPTKPKPVKLQKSTAKPSARPTAKKPIHKAGKKR